MERSYLGTEYVLLAGFQPNSVDTLQSMGTRMECSKLCSEYFRPVFQDEECVLELGRQAAVSCHCCPVIVPHLDVHSPRRQHGLYRVQEGQQYSTVVLETRGSSSWHRLFMATENASSGEPFLATAVRLSANAERCTPRGRKKVYTPIVNVWPTTIFPGWLFPVAQQGQEDED